MSALLEYLKLLPKGIANADKVIEGIINNVKFKHGDLPEDEQNEIIRRRAICAGCPFMSENAKAAGNYISQRGDPHCIHCQCDIEWKTSSLASRCGISVWNHRNPKNQMPLKWDVYKN